MKNTGEPSDYLSETHRVRAVRRQRRFGRLADKCSRFVGSAKFLLFQSIVIAVWVAANSWLNYIYTQDHPGCIYLSNGLAHFRGMAQCRSYVRPLDPYPFTLLTLCLSVQAAFATPLILMAQNRQKLQDARRVSADRLEARERRTIGHYLIDELIDVSQFAEQKALKRSEFMDEHVAVPLDQDGK